VSSSDRTVRRQQIEDSTAARLAEIVAAAEQAAKQVIDEAEAEARERLSDAHEEADRIVAERLAALVALTDEIGAQAEALKRGAEALQAALGRARLEIGGAEAFAGPTTTRRHEPEPQTDHQVPPGPALTVVGSPDRQPPPDRGSIPDRAPDFDRAPEREPAADRDTAPDRDLATGRRSAPERATAPVEADDFDSEPPAANGTPAGARLLATQMAVSGSSREEIEARLRSGFSISDARPILDAILGPEK
jgi:vacuolar-type H+-ATPase subunit H